MKHIRSFNRLFVLSLWFLPLAAFGDQQTTTYNGHTVYIDPEGSRYLCYDRWQYQGNGHWTCADIAAGTINPNTGTVTNGAVGPVTAAQYYASLGAAFGSSQTTTHLVVTPSAPVFDCKNILGVPLDAAPGFGFGSIAAAGGGATTCPSGGAPTAQTDMYLASANLFPGRSITLGDVASLSYWTKKANLRTPDVRNWSLAIYTKPYEGDVSTRTWYGDRIGAEPRFSADPSEIAGAWNQWTTDGPANRLRFFESTEGAPGAYSGSYGDPDWSTFVARKALSGQPYSSREILSFSLSTASAQTGNAQAIGFTGQVGGLRIQLTDGSVATVSFEPFLVATDAEACKNNGWINLRRTNGSMFRNQDDCGQYPAAMEAAR